MSAFAPLHIPSELEGMKIVDALLDGILQIAVFDFTVNSHCRAAVYPGTYNGGFHPGVLQTSLRSTSRC